MRDPRRNEKELSDPKIVSALFREAVFFESPVEFTSKGLTFRLKISELFEENSRSKETKIIRLQSVENHDLETSIDGEFNAVFPSFNAKWEGKIETKNGQLQCTLPKVIVFWTERKRRRLLAKWLFESSVNRVSIRTNNLHSVGFFKVNDLSDLDIGGTLAVERSLPIDIGTQISGTVQFENGSLKVSGIVQRTKLITDAETQGDLRTYEVGIIKNFNQNIESSDDIKKTEKRKYTRNTSETIFECFSALNKDHLISGKLLDFSAAGALLTLTHSADRVLLPVGISITQRKSSLQFQVVGVSTSGLHLQIIGGSHEDRLSWCMKTRDRNCLPSIGSPTGLDLLELFCKSGAFNSTYLRNHSIESDAFIKGLAKEQLYSRFVHRWIDYHSDGRIKGHISSIRIGESLWYPADAAGSPEDSLKMNPEFISMFFESFSEFAIASTPCPRVILPWEVGHPYWKKFESFLRSNSDNLLAAEILTSYFRISPRSLHISSDKYRITSITSDQHSLISKTHNKMNPHHSLFAKSVDFSIETFGTPSLTQHLDQSRIKREYALISTNDGEEWLAVFSCYPYGTCLHRSTDVTWLIPLGDSAFVPDVAQLTSAVQIFGQERGFSAPGILVCQPNDAKINDSSKLMQWFIAHPEALKHFRRFR